jgi:hypothetical protein
MLAGVIGERNFYRHGALEAAARYIEDTRRVRACATSHALRMATRADPTRTAIPRTRGS